MTAAMPALQIENTDRSAQGHSQPRERTPWLLALLCLLIPILPTSSVLPGPLKGNGSPARIIAILLLGLIILGFFVIRRTALTQTVRPGVFPILAYFFLLLIVYGVGISHLDGEIVEANKTRSLILVLANIGVALYAVTRVSTFRQRSFVLGFLIIGITFNCVVGLIQNALHIDLQLLFQPPGFVTNRAQGITRIAPTLNERFGASRVQGTSGHAIEFAVLAAAAVPLAIHFSRYAEKAGVRLLALIAAGVALAAIPAGVSRSGVVALAAALLIYIWTLKVRQILVAVTIGIAALLIEFAIVPRNLQALWLTITHSAEDESVLDRVADYARVSQTVHEHPLFGLGLGGTSPEVYGYLDNEWLQAIAQGGAVGLIAITMLAGSSVFGLAAALRSSTNNREKDQAYAIGAMLIGILASSYTFDLFSFQQATLVFFILIGLLWSSSTVTFKRSDSHATFRCA